MCGVLREWLVSEAPTHIYYGILSMVGMPHTQELVHYIRMEEAACGEYSASRLLKRIRHIRWILRWMSEDRRWDNAILREVAGLAMRDALVFES